jgi:hypothetical protein
VLSRFLFVLGQSALCSVVYTEYIANFAKKFPSKFVEPEEQTQNGYNDKNIDIYDFIFNSSQIK